MHEPKSPPSSPPAGSPAGLVSGEGFASGGSGVASDGPVAGGVHVSRGAGGAVPAPGRPAGPLVRVAPAVLLVVALLLSLALAGLGFANRRSVEGAAARAYEGRALDIGLGTAAALRMLRPRDRASLRQAVVSLVEGPIESLAVIGPAGRVVGSTVAGERGKLVVRHPDLDRVWRGEVPFALRRLRGGDRPQYELLVGLRPGMRRFHRGRRPPWWGRRPPPWEARAPRHDGAPTPGPGGAPAPGPGGAPAPHLAPPLAPPHQGETTPPAPSGPGAAAAPRRSGAAASLTASMGPMGSGCAMGLTGPGCAMGPRGPWRGARRLRRWRRAFRRDLRRVRRQGTSPGRLGVRPRWRRWAFGQAVLRVRLQVDDPPIRGAVTRARFVQWAALGGGGLLFVLALLAFYAMRRAAGMRRQMVAQQHLADMGEMAAVLAHEIRNPLGVIKGYAQLLGERADPSADPDGKQTLDRVVGEAGRLERLVNGLLDYARPAPPSRRPGDLAVLAGQAAELVAAEAAQGQVRLLRDLSPAPAQADPDQVLQVVLNLLRNGVEACPEGGVVTLRAGQRGGEAFVEVIDSGSGLPAGLGDEIFKPFVTTRTDGTGLGLAVSRRIAEAHGGRLTARSGPDGGARFRLSLPAERALP